MRKSLILIGTWILAFVLVACSASQEPDDNTPPQDSTQSDGYPVQSEDGYPVGGLEDEGYPIQTGDGYPATGTLDDDFLLHLTPVAPDAETSDTTGGLSVTLLYPDETRPVRGQVFFAAFMLPVEGVEDGYIPRLDINTAPSGQSDSSGKVNISFIEPGRYALTMMTPQGPILLEQANSGESIVFEIEANEITDLGVFVVSLDPESLEP